MVYLQIIIFKSICYTLYKNSWSYKKAIKLLTTIGCGIRFKQFIMMAEEWKKYFVGEILAAKILQVAARSHSLEKQNLANRLDRHVMNYRCNNSKEN